MTKKRGVSNVVITILLVLLALGAVLLLWGLVRTQLGESEQQIRLTKACLDLTLEPVSCRYDIVTNETTVRYKRGAGETGFDLRKVAIVLELADGGSEVIQTEEVPDFLETKVYNSAPLAFAPTKAGVAGVLATQEGEEKVCGESPVEIECSPL